MWLYITAEDFLAGEYTDGIGARGGCPCFRALARVFPSACRELIVMPRRVCMRKRWYRFSERDNAIIRERSYAAHPEGFWLEIPGLPDPRPIPQEPDMSKRIAEPAGGLQ